jgi:aldehyde:ferredoxin oxidoreductase
MAEFGYAGGILKVDLSDGKATILDTADYADKYIGGHGIAARLYWEMVPAQAKATDTENCLICASGPLTGFPGFAGFRWKACGKTMLDDPESFSYCNLGERWGAWLKYAGYDALVVQGKADRPVYLFIHDDKVEIRDASHLWGQTTFDASDNLKAELGYKVSVLTVGPAGENLIPYSNMLAEGGASGSGGLGVIMGSKKLKAIVVAAGDRRPAAAYPERVRELVDRVKATKSKSTTPSLWAVPGLTRDHACYGCGIGCSRQSYKDENNRTYKALCEASMFYMAHVMKYAGKDNGEHLLATRLSDGYGIDTAILHGMIPWLEGCFKEGLINEKETGLPLSKVGSPEFIEELTRQITYRDGFGEILARGTSAAATAIGPKAEETLKLYIATRGNETKDYDPRITTTLALLYALEPRRPIQQLHEIAMPLLAWLHWAEGDKDFPYSSDTYRQLAAGLWGSETAADFSTNEGKALAARKLQDRVLAKESLVICDIKWTMAQAFRFGGGFDGPLTENDVYNRHRVIETSNMKKPRKRRASGKDISPVIESEIYSAITGKETDEAGLYRKGERIFNLQRAILVRQGWPGRKGDKLLDYYHDEPLRQGEIHLNQNGLVPGYNGEVISKLGAVIDRDEFEEMKSEYYNLRGWDVETGLPTKTKLEELDLSDVAEDLASRGLLK